MARYVTGSDVVEVFATGAVLVDPRGEGDIDTAVITMWHENGAIPDRQQRQAVYGYDQRVEVFGSAVSWPRQPRVNTTTLHAPAAFPDPSCRPSSSNAGELSAKWPTSWLRSAQPLTRVETTAERRW